MNRAPSVVLAKAADEVKEAVQFVLEMLANIQLLNLEQEECLKQFIAGKDDISLFTVRDRCLQHRRFLCCKQEIYSASHDQTLVIG